MQHWAQGKEDLTYLELPDGKSRTDLILEEHTPPGIKTLVYVDTVDFLIERRLNRFAGKRGLTLKKLSSPMFLSPDDWIEEVMGSMKKPLMKTFYQAQRKRMNILLEKDGTPVGGKWSFDDENRKKLPKTQPIPEPYSAPLDSENFRCPDVYSLSHLSHTEHRCDEVFRCRPFFAHRQAVVGYPAQPEAFPMTAQTLPPTSSSSLSNPFLQKNEDLNLLLL